MILHEFNQLELNLPSWKPPPTAKNCWLDSDTLQPTGMIKYPPEINRNIEL